MTLAATTVPLWRKIVSGAGGLVAAAALFFSIEGSDAYLVALPIVLLAIAALLVHRPKLGEQLFARAVWWSNLALGTVLAILGAARERGAGAWMALGCAVALLVIGKKGLGEASERAGYAPAAFKSSLLLLMVLAMADAQTFLLFGFLSVNKSHHQLLGAIILAAGLACVVGFVGLLRLRTWGVLINVGACALLLAAMVLGGDGMKSELRVFITIICGMHVLAAAPLLLAMTTGWRPPAIHPRWRTFGASSVVVGLTLASAASWLCRN